MSRIKRSMVSRYEGGCIVEIDYKQLEVVVLALLSNDPVLIKDLNDGLDMHSLSATFLRPDLDYNTIVDRVARGCVADVNLRKKAKACSFLVQFGGQAKALSVNTGISETLAQDFIDNYYKRYKVVGDWQWEVKLKVEASTRAENNKVIGTWVNPFGTTFNFQKHENQWTSKLKYKPTELKNYPVQGTAADIVKTALALLVPTVYTFWGEDVKVCNTIHDSFILDVRDPDILPELAGVCRQVLTTGVMDMLCANSGVKFPVPLAVDIEVGDNWNDLMEIEEYGEHRSNTGRK